MTKLLTPIFLFHFASWFEFFYEKYEKLFKSCIWWLKRSVLMRWIQRKNPALYIVCFLKKPTRKTSKMEFFAGFSFFSSKTIPCKELGFFALHSVHQDASFELSNTTFEQFFRFFVIRGGQKVTRHWKKDQNKNSEKIIQIRMKNGTRKLVVEVMSSDLVSFLYKMGHSTLQPTKSFLHHPNFFILIFF